MSERAKIRFGICGLGFMGRQYCAHLAGHRDALVAAWCDTDPQRRAGRWDEEVGNLPAAATARQAAADVRPHERWQDLIADDALDAVAVTLPTALHADVCAAALAAGKHVICEKPMALTLADCDRMIAAARDSGRTLMIAQCIRFWPQYEEIERRVRTGEIGPVRFARLRRLASVPDYSAGGWLLDARLSGGALFDLHVHDVDFAQYLLGVPQDVQAVGLTGPSGGIDQVAALYSYEDGRYAVLEGGWLLSAPWPFEMAITVVGERGTLDWSMNAGPQVRLYRGGATAELIEVPGQTGWQRELDYFIECLLAGRPPRRCLPESSRQSIELVLREKAACERGGRH